MASLPGLELPVSGIASATTRTLAAYAKLHDALIAGDHSSMLEASYAIRAEATRLQALSSVIAQHIIGHRTRHVRGV